MDHKTSAEIKYADIINASRPRSALHSPMARIDRAAQFAPFSALTGYEAAVEETARLTDPRTELAEDESARLDAALRRLAADERDSPVRITYFRPDNRKAGGDYGTGAGDRSLHGAPSHGGSPRDPSAGYTPRGMGRMIACNE